MNRPPIVIVEDDRNIAALLGFIFEREGFEPVLLGDGRAAEQHVATAPPAAAVVLDLMLPCRDGFSVAAAIRADPRWCEVPIVMLSAKAEPAELERGRAVGVSAYLPKPFHPRTLVERVKALLRRSAA